MKICLFIFQILIITIVLLGLVIGIVCLTFQAWPDELYARLMNRPLNTLIIPEHAIVLNNLQLK